MRNKNIVDCRNLLDAKQAEKNGFRYQGIGKETVLPQNTVSKAA